MYQQTYSENKKGLIRLKCYSKTSVRSAYHVNQMEKVLDIFRDPSSDLTQWGPQPFRRIGKEEEGKVQTVFDTQPIFDFVKRHRSFICSTFGL
mmetsp:Transcript_17947/g.37420  ORF Transcript_17947/g.37420 Transcript_17947/m.37420 type:complete len:93 (-) Transcript_17947:2107-2385(-)